MTGLWRYYRDIKGPLASLTPPGPRSFCLIDVVERPLLVDTAELTQPTLAPHLGSYAALLWAVSSRCRLSLPKSQELDILRQGSFCRQALVEQQEAHTLLLHLPSWDRAWLVQPWPCPLQA